jgi:PAS domain S-box-containing protein
MDDSFPFKRLLDVFPNPVFLLDSKSRVVYVNRALEEWTGFRLSDVVGTSPPFPWWPEEALTLTTQRFNEALNWGPRKAREMRVRKNGEQLWVETTSIPIDIEGRGHYRMGLWVDISDERQFAENLEQVLRRMDIAQEQERTRIARELHDEAAQLLASMIHDIDRVLLANKQVDHDFRDLMTQLRGKLYAVIGEIKKLVSELRPVTLKRFGLVPSLKMLLISLSQETQLNHRFEVCGKERRLSATEESVVYRITQEAIRNIKRHSHATNVILNFEFQKDKFVLNITDDGVGFDVPAYVETFAETNRYGIIGMDERIRLIGGNLTIFSQPGKGCTLSIELPLGCA